MRRVPVRDASIETQSVGDIRQILSGEDILGVINMSQILTFAERPAERRDLPGSL